MLYLTCVVVHVHAISYVQVVVASLGILSLGNWGLIDDWPKHWGQQMALWDTFIMAW